MSAIPSNLSQLQQQIRTCEERYGRLPHSVNLVAVSKGQSIAKIKEAAQAGQRIFGENYLQEALPKIAALQEQNLEWHFIGPIQSNKTKKIAEHFAWVHSVYNKQIAQRLNDQRPAHLPALQICLQINISQEKTKSGIVAEDLISLALYCRDLPHLKLRGLMAIPAPQTHFQQQRNTYQTVKKYFAELNEQGFNLDTLSMGMSDDLEAAIAEGATMIRIGTKILGGR